MTRVGRRRLAAAGGVVVLLLIVVVLRSHLDMGTAAVVDGPMVATASSSRLGHSPPSALATADGQAGWEPAGDAAGSWWRLELRDPARISQMMVGQAAGFVAPTRVMLRFGDGTKLVARLGSAVSRIDFVPRTVRSVRIDVIARSGAVPLRLVDVGLASTNDPSTPQAGSGGGRLAAGVTALSGGRPADALIDGGAGSLGEDWISPSAGRATVTIRFGRPQEIAGLELIGSGSGGASLRGVVAVAGDRIRIGGVLADPSRPTQVAFPPRVVRSLRLALVGTEPAAPLRLSGLAVLPTGQRFTTPAPSGVRLPVGQDTAAGCGDEPAPSAPSHPVLRCPQTGAELTGTARVLVDVPSTGVTAALWAADGDGEVTPDVEVVGPHTVAVRFDAARLPAGPIALAVTDRSQQTPPAVFSFENTSADRADAATEARSPIGGRLVYAEEFDGPVTASLDGTTGLYTAAKPEIQGISSFGDAPFADPQGPDGTLRVDDGMLRLDVKPGSEGSVGAMLASSRSGGSGFSAQYGYFEARMRMPIATGSWGAFWVLPSSNLAEGSSNVAEFDAVEVYGHDPKVTCAATHHFRAQTTPTGQTFCGERWETIREAAGWHTYGLLVLPGEVVFFVDGKQVAVGEQLPGGDEPMFFMADLALGGGWPVDLSASEGRIQAYVDWIRVYE